MTPADSSEEEMSKSTVKVHSLNVGTLNVQGCREESKQRNIIDDAFKYNLQILGLTETHVKDEGTTTINVKRDNRISRTYQVFFSGIEDTNTFSGTGIAIEDSLHPRFKRISDHIATANCKLDEKHHVNIIVAYAPTLIKSEKDPQIRKNFYCQLEQVTSKQRKNKHLLLVLGDFNAKTGSGHTLYPENIGKYGKGHINSNGEYLLDYAKDNHLVITNTLFPHKLAHRTTWTSLERVNQHLSKDGTVRRNPYRNQIDYIATKLIHRKLVQNSRSYSGITTSTDHKLVKAEFKLEWWRLRKQCIKSTCIDVDKLRDPDLRGKYKTELNIRLIEGRKDTEHPDASWKRISQTCKETAKEILGLKEPNKRQSSSKMVLELSAKQKKLRDDGESTRNKDHRIQIKRERNKTFKALQKQLRIEKDNKLDLELKDIERYKDDSNKCHQAIRKVRSHKPKKPLNIFDNNHNRVTSQDDQLTIITEYFSKLFASDDQPEKITPVKIEPEYTAEEIESAARKLKNNKATGRDEIHAEFIKYGSPELYYQIAQLLNITSQTGDYPEEIRRGILNPLSKPPKKEEKVNVRPIILLSVLRKIITITLIDRCWECMKTHIPPSQAAYQKGRSTTEQVLTIKLLAEKAITSENFDIFLLLLDMSKAFDTVNRSKLMNILKDILTPNELHIMHLLVNDVILNVR